MISTTAWDSPWQQGLKDAMPLLGGYIPVAISFGLISLQAGFSVWETILISTVIYAGSNFIISPLLLALYEFFIVDNDLGAPSSTTGSRRRKTAGKEKPQMKRETTIKADNSGLNCSTCQQP